MRFVWPLFISAVVLFAVFSYGFIDPNLTLFSNSHITALNSAASGIVYRNMPMAAGLYAGIMIVCFLSYRLIVWRTQVSGTVRGWLICLVVVLLVSYPALSYDIFNYILTAKVSFLYGENPYVVMPIEIPNEPMLAFTRAANKLALYGPTWIMLTSLPYLAGSSSMMASILSFKTFVAMFYLAVAYLIYRKTNHMRHVLFFSLNPLVLFEVLVSGHNDIVMMAFAISGLLMWGRTKTSHRIIGMVLFAASVLVKGATVVLLPLFFLRGMEWERKMSVATILMFGVFLLTPFREEMYPWYAVWWLVPLSFVRMHKRSFLHEAAYFLSLGLMLRYVPWIASREYGGATPMWRIVLTVVPVVVGAWWYFRGSKVLRTRSVRRLL